MSERLYIGLMSGTSLDGIDAVLFDFSRNRLVGRHYLPYDDEIRLAILDLHKPSSGELHRAQLIANRLARLYADAVLSLLAATGKASERIAAIGCHGQTIRHCPEQGYTLQIGNAALLAELTKIAVVSDFRSRDIAAGGQGAPLVPAFHDRIMRDPEQHRIIVNIGGISNMTDLKPGRPTFGYDCGPGNLLMDAWCKRHKGEPYDANGAWAATGRAIPELLSKMLSETYFSLPPPKSCGRDLFNAEWLDGLLEGIEQAADVQATLLELTCRAIADRVEEDCAIYLCGGGAKNLALKKRLAELLPDCTVQTTNELDVDSDYLEAIAFAWLAEQNLAGKPANLPEVTGARHPCILGAVYPA